MAATGSNKDEYAGLHIRELREDLGLSPEDLAYLIARKTPRNSVSPRTIRRIEQTGMVPRVRAKFGIAQAFGMVPSQIWCSRTRVPA